MGVTMSSKNHLGKMSSPTRECQKLSADREKVGLEFVECSIHRGGKWMKRRLASALPRCYIPMTLQWVVSSTL